MQNVKFLILNKFSRTEHYSANQKINQINLQF